MSDKFPTREERLAKQFHALVRRDLPGHLAEIDRRNALPDMEGCCATHDFCDANEIMADAFKDTFGCEIDLNEDLDLRIWNGAWTIAKSRGFNKEWK